MNLNISLAIYYMQTKNYHIINVFSYSSFNFYFKIYRYFIFIFNSWPFYINLRYKIIYNEFKLDVSSIFKLYKNFKIKYFI